MDNTPKYNKINKNSKEIIAIIILLFLILGTQLFGIFGRR
jgi:hypothetical protein